MSEEVKQTPVVNSRTTVEIDNTPVTKVFKTGKPVAYTASEGVYVDGTLFKPGEPFVTDKPKGSTWEYLDAKEKAAADAGKDIPGDVNFDAMELPALKAYAAAERINLGEAKSKADIITVIKAANEPTL
jgi:hypothetical protein